jgi:hypothetical protein
MGNETPNPPLDLFGEPSSPRRRGPKATQNAPPAPATTTTAFDGAVFRWRNGAILPIRWMHHRTGDHGPRPVRAALEWFAKRYTKRKLAAILLLAIGGVAADARTGGLHELPAPPVVTVQQPPLPAPKPVPRKPKPPPEKSALEQLFPWAFKQPAAK